MTNNLKPTTLNGIRSLAKDLKKELKCKHGAALNIAAKQAGYENYTHAQKQLSQEIAPVMRAISPLSSNKLGKLKEYHQLSLDKWGEAILSVNPNLKQTLEWTSPSQMAEIINLFVGNSMDHAHFPNGGGFDVDHVEVSQEKGCLELVLAHRTRHLFKARRLVLEFIEEAPGESFLYIETKKIKAVDVDTTYIDEPGEFYKTRQEIVRVGHEHYPRAHWDESHLGYDENGDKNELPDNAHILVRWETGNFMIVSKGTLWNGTSKTYGGVHNDLTTPDIREAILKGITDIAA